MSEQPLSDPLARMLPIVEEAGRIALSHFGKALNVTYKAGDSPVTDADYAVDAFLRRELGGAFPDHGWLSEETADSPHRLGKRSLFVVDPIDGTRAFMGGDSVWCVSVARIVDGMATDGILVCPARGETYTASRGGGAFRNGARIGALEPSRRFVTAGPKPLLDRAQSAFGDRLVRHRFVPSLAYRIAMVADGRLHGTFVKPNSHDWDIAAADVLLSEAGGRIVDADGKAIRYNRPSSGHGPLVAAHASAIEPMLAVVREAAFG